MPMPQIRPGYLVVAATCLCVAGGCGTTWPPPMPKHLPEVATVEVPCKLPPPPELGPMPHASRCGAAADRQGQGGACYDPENAARLRRVAEEMEVWVAKARAGCVVEDAGVYRMQRRADYQHPSMIQSNVTWCGSMFCGPVATGLGR